MAGFDMQREWARRQIAIERMRLQRERNRRYNIDDFLHEEMPRRIPEPMSAKVHVSCVDGKLVRD